MSADATRRATLTECDGGYHVELAVLGYPSCYFVCWSWFEVVELLRCWATGVDAKTILPREWQQRGDWQAPEKERRSVGLAAAQTIVAELDLEDRFTERARFDLLNALCVLVLGDVAPAGDWKRARAMLLDGTQPKPMRKK